MKICFKGNEVRFFCFISVFLLFFIALLFDSPMGIYEGLLKIITSRDVLVTDYFELVGYGAAFFNAGLVMMIAILAIEIEKIPYTGLTIAVLFINAGFGLWGKNFINTLPIICGTYLYAHVQGSSFGRYIYTGLFATCLAPFVTEIYYLLPYSSIINLCIACICGVIIGFLMPPIAMHTTTMHMGYSLFNVGFAGGILAFVINCIFHSLSIETNTAFIWKSGYDLVVVIGLFIYFGITFIYGLLLEKGDIQKLFRITRHPGRAVADFILMDSPGATLMNMGVMGLLASFYVLLVGGDFSGPILGCLFTIFGFSAFGAHPLNYLPVLLGVYLSTFMSQFHPNDPSILIAALFVVGLSPIAGQFGPLHGIIAGMLHSFVVVCCAPICGGYNLYNNGFSMGWVAIVLVPTFESFMKHFDKK